MRILDDVQDKLTKKGTFIGIDWYSKNCSDFINRKTKNNYLYFKSGVFKNIGGVFFSNKKDILNFFKKFKIIHLSEKKIETFRKKKKYIVSWSIVAEKMSKIVIIGEYIFMCYGTILLKNSHQVEIYESRKTLGGILNDFKTDNQIFFRGANT